MQYEEFISEVQVRAGLASPDEAEQATGAVLRTLGERLSGGETDDLAAQLPPGVGHHVTDGARSETNARPFSVTEFFERVSAREGVDLPVASQHAQGVMQVLQQAVTKGELDDIRSQLSRDFGSLFQEETA